MARVLVTRSVGMLLLAIYLILAGLTAFLTIGLPSPIMGLVALAAGIAILLGR
jgi:uncharacterized membrane protein (DUF485 family)